MVGGSSFFTPTQVAEWRSAGVVVADGLLDAPLLSELRRQASGCSTAEWQRFPAGAHLSAVNRAALHERVILGAAQLLGEHDARRVRLVSASLVNSSFPVSSGDDEGGSSSAATTHAAVPSTASIGAVELVVRWKDLAAEPCTAVACRLGLLHPSCEQGAAALVLHVLYRRMCAEWVSSDHFIGQLAGQDWFGSELSPLQRSVVGLPPPGHPYWNRAALEQLEERYPGFDTAPYRAHLLGYDGSGGGGGGDGGDDGRNVQHSGSIKATATFLSESERIDSLPTPPWRSDEYAEGGGADSGPSNPRWLTPELLPPYSAAAADGPTIASEEQVEQWRSEGFLCIDGLFPSDLIDRAAIAASLLFPDDLQSTETGRPFVGEAMGEAGYHHTGYRHTGGSSSSTGGGGAQPKASFPFEREGSMSALNEVSLHPRLLALLSQLLGTEPEQLRLTQCFITAKFGEAVGCNSADQQQQGWHASEDHQPMHRDVGTNSLLQPARDAIQWRPDPEEVQGILYLGADAAEAGAPTAFVPDSLRCSDPGVDDLYERERWPQYRRGTLLLWQLGMWHRGTPVAAGAVRRKQHLSFRRVECEWVGGSSGMGQASARTLHELSAATVWHAQQTQTQTQAQTQAQTQTQTQTQTQSRTQSQTQWRAAVDREIGGFLGTLSPLQRTVMLGFPSLGSWYWTTQTLDGVAQRFEGQVDVRPYEVAMVAAAEAAVAGCAKL